MKIMTELEAESLADSSRLYSDLFAAIDAAMLAKGMVPNPVPEPAPWRVDEIPYDESDPATHSYAIWNERYPNSSGIPQNDAFMLACSRAAMTE